MSKFKVRVYEVHSVVLNIEADNEDEARQIATEIIENGQYPNGENVPDVVYDYTMDADDWGVWTVEG